MSGATASVGAIFSYIGTNAYMAVRTCKDYGKVFKGRKSEVAARRTSCGASITTQAD